MVYITFIFKVSYFSVLHHNSSKAHQGVDKFFHGVLAWYARVLHCSNTSKAHQGMHKRIRVVLARYTCAPRAYASIAGELAMFPHAVDTERC